MLGIMAGMDQKDSFAATQRPRSSPTSAMACAWLVLLVTLQFALCSLTRVWTCPLCATSVAYRDCAPNCGSLRSCSSSAIWSTEAYGRIFHIFYVTVNLDPEVVSLLAVEITACTHVSYDGFWKNLISSW